MRIKSLFAGAVLALGLAAVAPSSAQAQIGFVVQANYALDGIEAFGVGAGVNFGIGSLTEKHGIRGEATFDYFLPDDYGFGGQGYSYNYWQINANALMDIKAVQNLYVGTGLNYSKASVDYDGVGCDFCSNSDIGLNVIGGYKLGSGKAAPFVQGRLELGGGSNLVVTGGFRF